MPDMTLPTIDLNSTLSTVPSVVGDHMYDKAVRPDVTDLTSKTVNGSGVFDVLMASVSVHLKAEFEKGRITGGEYTKAYTDLTTACLSTATQFLLAREQAFWQAQTAQIGAITARVELDSAKMTLATKGIEYDAAKFNRDTTLPLQAATLTATKDGLLDDNQSKVFQRTVLLPIQQQLLLAQANAAWAQTVDNRLDGPAVMGVLGAQKALYTQQVTSYRQDALTKVAKIYADGWTVQKTLDEGLSPPTQLTNSKIDEVLVAVRTQAGVP